MKTMTGFGVRACRAFGGVVALALLAGGLFGETEHGIPARAKGGIETDVFVRGVKHTVHTFTNSGALTVIRGGVIEYLIVGGGGGGGGMYQGGGGGAGGFLEGTANVTGGVLRVAVGAGGIGYGQTGGITKGGDSFVEGLGLAYGGGYGAGESTVATGGGSGGGSAHALPTVGAGTEGPPRQGYDGGTRAECAGAGGGGAGGPGADAIQGVVVSGGPGRSSSLRDGVTMVTYAAGGKGRGRVGTNGEDGAANTGNGGGGGVDAGGNGGSGIVIVRYRSDFQNRPASSVTTNGATLRCLLAGTGTAVRTVCVLWGEENGAVSGSWAHTNWLNPEAWMNDNYLSTRLTNLTPDRNYHYTFSASDAATNVAAKYPVSFITGAVEVKTTQRESSEEQPAAFVITRPATTTNGTLDVYFTLGGKGVNGLDYDLIKIPAVIPAGASAVSLSVLPVFNFGSRESKLVELSLAPGGYLIGAKSNALILTRAQ